MGNTQRREFDPIADQEGYRPLLLNEDAHWRQDQGYQSEWNEREFVLRLPQFQMRPVGWTYEDDENSSPCSWCLAYKHEIRDATPHSHRTVNCTHLLRFEREEIRRQRSFGGHLSAKEILDMRLTTFRDQDMVANESTGYMDRFSYCPQHGWTTGSWRHTDEFCYLKPDRVQRAFHRADEVPDHLFMRQCVWVDKMGQLRSALTTHGYEKETSEKDKFSRRA